MCAPPVSGSCDNSDGARGRVQKRRAASSAGQQRSTPVSCASSAGQRRSTPVSCVSVTSALGWTIARARSRLRIRDGAVFCCGAAAVPRPMCTACRLPHRTRTTMINTSGNAPAAAPSLSRHTPRGAWRRFSACARRTRAAWTPTGRSSTSSAYSRPVVGIVSGGRPSG